MISAAHAKMAHRPVNTASLRELASLKSTVARYFSSAHKAVELWRKKLMERSRDVDQWHIWWVEKRSEDRGYLAISANLR